MDLENQCFDNIPYLLLAKTDKDGSFSPIGRESEELYLKEIEFAELKQGDCFVLVNYDHVEKTVKFTERDFYELNGEKIEQDFILSMAIEDAKDGAIASKYVVLDYNDSKFIFDMMEKVLVEKHNKKEE